MKVQREVNDIAQDIRSRIFENHALMPSVATLAPEISIHDDLYESYKLNNAKFVVDYNKWCLKKSVDKALAEISDVHIYPFVCSRLIEIFGIHLWDPAEKKNYTNLSASKKYGHFFTPPEVAIYMAKLLTSGTEKVESVFDPACGGGGLLAAVLLALKGRISGLKYIKGYEISPLTAQLASKILKKLLHDLGFNCELSIVCDDYLSHSNGREYSHIIMNPPYGQVRFLKSSLTNDQTCVNKIVCLETEDRRQKQVCKEISNQLRQEYSGYGFQGIIEFSKIFTGRALSQLKEDGCLVVITPSGWLSSKDSEGFRRNIFQHRKLQMFYEFSESSSLFETVNQHVSVTKYANNGNMNILFSFNKKMLGEKTDLEMTSDDIIVSDPKLVRVPKVQKMLLPVLKKLTQNPRVKDLKGLVNLRGEFDLSVNKQLLSDAPSDIPLVRGDAVERYYYDSTTSTKGTYCSPYFIDTIRHTKKYEHFKMDRLVCRQCSYLNKKRRLSFARIPKETVVSNSCNYVVSNDESISLDAILVIFNSILFDWLFRAYNNNNHVSNYEIDELPLPYDLAIDKQLNAFGYFLRRSFGYSIGLHKIGLLVEDYIDAYIFSLFGLTPEESESIVAEIEPSRAERVSRLLNGIRDGKVLTGLDSETKWFNNQSQKLSDLDRLIIQHVPEGGNWQDLPEDIPSERIKQIRQMTKERGVVRTTYYSRLMANQPAYTISTYFNRPGNGANINPWINATLTSREAARLQSFPDFIYFYGTETSIRNQIGNAVPPILGFAIAKTFVHQCSGLRSIDLFCGAGGLSLGFELGGVQSIMAVDNDSSALETFKLNLPVKNRGSHANVLNLDLQNEDSLAKIFECYQRSGIQSDNLIVVGGPPCQGFSHAGWRQATDQRNQLVYSFFNCIDRVRPMYVLMENVEGILTMQKGQVIFGIYQALNELGYHTNEPWVLSAEQYGVPQMRKRVFITASKNKSLLPKKPTPVFAKCLGRREKKNMNTLFSLPYPVCVDEAIGEFAGIELPAGLKLFSKWAKGVLSTEDFLSMRAKIFR